jgi:23S rRNA pseudouridine1911/1915/1917 synthase
MRLSDHLKHLGLSSTEAKRAMRSGKVFLHGIPTADAGRDVQPFQVEYRPDAPKLTPGRDLVIVYKDPHLVVIWKPSGLLSVPAGKAGGHLNVVGLVGKLTRGEALAVHRLDQDTSGLMMVARTRAAQEALKAQLEVHSVERCYMALVLGKTEHQRWTVSNHLVEDRGDGLRGSIEGKPSHFSKHAKTHFSQLERVGRRVNLVEARLETGRTHQVRIHLSEGAKPILGDKRYGSSSSVRMADRLCLHAAVLGLDHPVSGERMRFTSALPDDMEQIRRSFIFEHKNPTRKRIKNKTPKKRRAPKKP